MRVRTAGSRWHIPRVEVPLRPFPLDLDKTASASQAGPAGLNAAGWRRRRPSDLPASSTAGIQQGAKQGKTHALARSVTNQSQTKTPSGTLLKGDFRPFVTDMTGIFQLYMLADPCRCMRLRYPTSNDRPTAQVVFFIKSIRFAPALSNFHHDSCRIPSIPF